MTRNPSDPGWIETEEISGSTPPWRQRGQQREPLNWPTVLLGVAALAALVAVAWLCSGAAVQIWGA